MGPGEEMIFVLLLRRHLLPALAGSTDLGKSQWQLQLCNVVVGGLSLG
jgi:hypothetical protein